MPGPRWEAPASALNRCRSSRVSRRTRTQPLLGKYRSITCSPHRRPATGTTPRGPRRPARRENPDSPRVKTVPREQQEQRDLPVGQGVKVLGAGDLEVVGALDRQVELRLRR